MKKLLFLIILIIAAALPAVPYYIGMQVEETFRTEHQEAANDAALSGFDVELVDYQRGLIESSAITRVSIAVPEGQESISVDFRHQISHIPQLDQQVLATVNSSLALSSEASRALNPLFKGQSPLTIKTRIYLDGHQEGSISSPVAQGQLVGEKEKIDIDWKGLTGTAWQASARDRVTFKLYLPGLSASPVRSAPSTDEATAGKEIAENTTEQPVEELAENTSGEDSESVVEESVAPSESIAFTELRYTGDLTRGESGIWHGTAEGSISSVAVNVVEGGSPFSILINSINLNGEQSENNGLIKAGGAVSANSINVNGFMLSNAVYDVAVANIDANALLAWQQSTAQMMKGTADPEKMFEPLFAQIPALFKAKPIIRFKDISVDSPMGRFALKLDTRVTGEWDEMILQNPALIVPMLKIDLEANVPRSVVAAMLKDKIRDTLLMQAALSETEINAEELEATVELTVNQQLAGMIAQGLIKEEGAQLHSQVQFNKGQLMVNGIDASAMLGGMM
ncbi:MAG: YdgA family protein [Chromatiales bacterium]|nr:YdgA family protein [Chromatiales bacterium]